MPAVASKVCLLGEPGVGKTRLLQRLHSGAAAAVPTTPGVRVLPARLAGRDGRDLDVTLWDVNGRCPIDCLNQAFLSGADAVLALADAERPETLDTARRLVAHVKRLNPGVRALLLLDTPDLATDAAPVRFERDATPGVEISLRTGHGIGGAIADLVDVLRR